MSLRKSICLIIGVATAAVAFSSSAPAQAPARTFNGVSAASTFGYSVAGAIDVNNDGFDDLVVGAPWEIKGTSTDGAVRVYSGFDGAILHGFTGSTGELLGSSVSGAGDLNNDGFSDLVVSGRAFSSGAKMTGAAHVFSGKDGSTLFLFVGDGDGDNFGVSVKCAGDVNADGYDDLIVGADKDDDTGTDSGSARVLSGKDGVTLTTFLGAVSFEYFGRSVSGAGDVDGDGHDDLVVGSPGQHAMAGCGLVRVHSGKSGAALYSFFGDSYSDALGSSVSSAGDVNGDGIPDVVAGAPAGTLGVGYARTYSGKDGSVLQTFKGEMMGDRLGTSVCSPGDLNNDGFADVMAGASSQVVNGSIPGYVRMYSGKDGAVLRDMTADAVDDQFGVSVGGAGDVNGNGTLDVIVGAHRDDAAGVDFGNAYVFDGASCQGTAVPYGAGCAGSSSIVPKLWLIGCPTPGGTVMVRLHFGVGMYGGLLAIGTKQVSVPFGNGCTLLTDPFVVVLPLFLAFGPGFDAAVTFPPSALTGTVHAQAFFDTLGIPEGIFASNGLTISVQ